MPISGALKKKNRLPPWFGVDVSELPLHNLDMPESGVDNMTDLGFLHEASILYNLKRRFETFQPYTRTGQIVIAVEPVL